MDATARLRTGHAELVTRISVAPCGFDASACAYTGGKTGAGISSGDADPLDPYVECTSHAQHTHRTLPVKHRASWLLSEQRDGAADDERLAETVSARSEYDDCLCWGRERCLELSNSRDAAPAWAELWWYWWCCW